jgi:hypothetical protein
MDLQVERRRGLRPTQVVAATTVSRLLRAAATSTEPTVVAGGLARTDRLSSPRWAGR